MSIVAITGDHPRHIYLVNKLGQTGLLTGWIRERREAFVPKPDADLSMALKELYRLHFSRREQAELRAFGSAQGNDHASGEVLDVDLDELNGKKCREFIAARKPGFVISYGCHKLGAATLAAGAPARYWNVHGGLSPHYRGVHTHFWPSFMLEPQMTGVTLHETTDNIDGGGIIHQTGVTLTSGDGLHDLACRSVKEFADALPKIMMIAVAAKQPIVGKQQKTPGRIWTASMWRPEHLVPIYKHFGDRIVDLCLNGVIQGRTPDLHRIDAGLEAGEPQTPIHVFRADTP